MNLLPVLFFLSFIFRIFAVEDFIAQDFDLLMGKECGGWKKIQLQEDLEALQFFKTVYDKNKEKQFCSEVQRKIPHTIHFIWLGPKNFPAASVENIRTWIVKNPEWRIKFWTDRERPPPCSGIEVWDIHPLLSSDLKRCFEASENWAEKSDLLRYEILFREGGVYVDHDANCLRSFDNLHSAYDFYACLEMPHPSVRELMISAGIGVVGARPSHPLIGKTLSKILEHWDEIGSQFVQKTPYMKAQLVLNRTYIVLTDMAKKYLGEDNNVDILFPASYFYARKGLTPIYSEHFYGEAWNSDALSSSENEMIKLCSSLSRRLNRIMQINALCLSLLLLVVFTFFKPFIKKLLPLIFLSILYHPLDAKEDFLGLMGKQTSEWRYIETKEDFKNLKLFEENYQKKREKTSQIPKIIHFFSFDDREDIQLKKTIDIWKKKHPDWKVKIWSRSDLDEKTIKKGVEYARLSILLNEGGVAFDPHLMCKSRIDELIESTDLLCFLAPLEAPFLSSSVYSIPSFVAVSRNNSILQRILYAIDRGWEEFEKQFPGTDEEALNYRRGYQIILPFDACIKDALTKDEDVTVLPWTALLERVKETKPYKKECGNHFQSKLQKKLERIEKKEHQLFLLSALILLFTMSIIFFGKRNDHRQKSSSTLPNGISSRTRRK